MIAKYCSIAMLMKVKHSDRIMKVLRLFLTNQIVLFQLGIAMLCLNLFVTSIPGQKVEIFAEKNKQFIYLVRTRWRRWRIW